MKWNTERSKVERESTSEDGKWRLEEHEDGGFHSLYLSSPGLDHRIYGNGSTEAEAWQSFIQDASAFKAKLEAAIGEAAAQAEELKAQGAQE